MDDLNGCRSGRAVVPSGRNSFRDWAAENGLVLCEIPMIQPNWNNEHAEQARLLMLEGIRALTNALSAPEKKRKLLLA
jgi:hypothetical protein